MKNHGPRPKNVAFGKFMLPDMSAKIWLKQAIIDPLVDVVLMSNADQDDSKADNGI